MTVVFVGALTAGSKYLVIILIICFNFSVGVVHICCCGSDVMTLFSCRYMLDIFP